MKRFKLSFLMMITAMTAVIFVGCNDDEGTAVDGPSVTAPSTVPSVEVGGTVTLDFTVSAPGEIASLSATSSQGSVSVTNESDAIGQTNATVTVSFTSASAGAANITLSVTDAQNPALSDDGSASVTVTDVPDGTPSISGIPATAEVTAGETLGPVPATITMSDLPGTLSIMKEGEEIESVDITSDGQTVDFSYATSIEESSSDVVFTFVATDSDGDASSEVTHVLSVEAPAFEIEILDGEITENMTLTADKIYELASRVTVVDGVTLTIEAGTVIKGQSGAGASATTLLIAQGGKLNANGTAAAPIIMTSASDDIVPGQIVSPNLDASVNGLWGGLIILGKAPISADAVPAQIEGIPPSDLNGQYGGDVANDNSGTISYVSIRHGGTNIGEGNEINGLTLGGVGTGTTINGIEVVANQDDGIECFGGTVDVSNVLIWNQGDDAYDMDQAYTGTIDNFIYIGGPDSDHGMELDGPEGTLEGAFTLTNGSLKGWNEAGTGGGEYVDLRSDVRCTINNSYYFNFSDDSDFEFDNNKVSQNYLDGDIILTNLQFNTSHLTTGNLTIADIFQEKTGDGETALDIFTTKPLDASIVVTETPTVGADKSNFAGWTWADAAGELADF